ncbi:MAG: hypothetical protein KDD44_03645 [Bdellovibrionales bacterium]|nr:hypothetical protein [Bdellovibrionales bacterium]
MARSTRILTLEERIARLEGKVGWRRLAIELDDVMFWLALVLMLAALGCAVYGLGAPNHYYQFVFAGLTVALAYHQGWLAIPQRAYQWSLAAANVLVLSIVFKLFIGSGRAQPFHWLKFPTISSEESDSTFAVVPSLRIVWEDSGASSWSIDLTVLQTFLMVITLVGALFQFQPFASLTAFLLVLVSIPALVGFDWPWVFPALLACAVGFYVQSAEANIEEL